jgi:Fe2+ transport system protein B
MRPMIWHPEEKDKKVNEYIDKTNRAPYFGIILATLGVLTIFCVAILLGVF